MRKRIYNQKFSNLFKDQAQKRVNTEINRNVLISLRGCYNTDKNLGTLALVNHSALSSGVIVFLTFEKCPAIRQKVLLKATSIPCSVGIRYKKGGKEAPRKLNPHSH